MATNGSRGEIVTALLACLGVLRIAIGSVLCALSELFDGRAAHGARACGW